MANKKLADMHKQQAEKNRKIIEYENKIKRIKQDADRMEKARKQRTLQWPDFPIKWGGTTEYNYERLNIVQKEIYDKRYKAFKEKKAIRDQRIKDIKSWIKEEEEATKTGEK